MQVRTGRSSPRKYSKSGLKCTGTAFSHSIWSHLWISACLLLKSTVIPPKFGRSGEEKADQKTSQLLALGLSCFTYKSLETQFLQCLWKNSSWSQKHAEPASLASSQRRSWWFCKEHPKLQCPQCHKEEGGRRKCIEAFMLLSTAGLCMRQLNYHSRYNDMHYTVSINSHWVFL